MIQIPSDLLAEAPRRWVITGPGQRQRVIDPEWHANTVAEIKRLSDLAAARERLEQLEAARAKAAEENARAEAQAVEKEQSDYATRLGRMMPLRRIVEEVAAQHGLAGEEMLGRRRDAKAADARSHVVYELRRHGPSLTQLGRLLRRDHTTVLHALRRWPARAAVLGIACDPLPDHLAPAPKESA